MSFAITQACISCNACKLVCPENAIKRSEDSYSITPHRCNECHGHYSNAQCASICPIENAIVDSQSAPINPEGSLSPTISVLEFIQQQQAKFKVATT